MSDESMVQGLRETSNRLSQVSPSFCLAKWLQVTLHLHNGHTHSCHHPNAHKIPLEELAESETALHNTKFKKQQRKDMLEGQRPAECGYCWAIEDAPGEHFSDRILKSSDEWARPHFDKVIQAADIENLNPTYVEVSFSHACNLRCAYCLPSVSSKWEAEIKKFGDYPMSSKHHSLATVKDFQKQPYPVDAYNPYVEAFWKWWPNLYKDLRTFRITGGEPLLVKDTFKVLDWLIENPQPKLELAINSNLSVPDRKIDEFIEKLKTLLENDRIRSLVVYTSLDTWGKSAEYIRNGLNLETFLKNVDKVLSAHPKMYMTFMCTYSMLSVPDFRGLLDYLRELKEKYPQRTYGHWPRITLDISYLRHPEFFAVPMLPKNFHAQMESDCEYMGSVLSKKGKLAFSAYETNKFKRVIAYAQRSLDAETELEYKKDFVLFFSEQDRRRGTDFRLAFPAFKDFYQECIEIFTGPLRSQLQEAQLEVETSSKSVMDAENYFADAKYHMERATDWYTRARETLKKSEEELAKLEAQFGAARGDDKPSSQEIHS